MNPIPAIVPPPTTAAQPTGGRRRRPVNRVASQQTPAIPTGLPTTYPKNMPSVTGDVTAAARRSPSMRTPMLASANSGTIT